jgi:hypothetical protein
VPQPHSISSHLGGAGKIETSLFFSIHSVADFRYHLIQLQDENLAPFWGGSGKPAPKKGSSEVLKKRERGEEIVNSDLVRLTQLAAFSTISTFLI